MEDVMMNSEYLIYGDEREDMHSLAEKRKL